MKQALFLGIATVLEAIGSFLATRQHFYSAYGLFGGAVLMAIAAIWVTYHSDHRRKRGKEELGKVLVALSECERTSYKANPQDYDRLYEQLEEIKQRVGEISRRYFDSSVESRFLAVNVFDVDLSIPMREHFITQGKGSFWTMFQQINGWRRFLNDFLRSPQ